MSDEFNDGEYIHPAEQVSDMDDFDNYIKTMEGEEQKGSGKPQSQVKQVKSSTKGGFNPESHMLNLKGKNYLPVAPRIAWFRQEHPDWAIETHQVRLAEKAVIMKAVIKDQTGRVIATARKKETESGFSDYIEKAETGAIGRALALCGYGTLQAVEFDEGERLADAPLAKG